MLTKIWVITQRELYATFTDINLLLIMFATPLALATIIGLALGGAASGESISNIPVAIVNQDTGDQGAILTGIFLPDVNTGNDAFGQNCEAVVREDNGDDAITAVTITDLTEAVLVEDEGAARDGVRAGTYAAAVIIPADFSERIGYSQDNPTIEPVTVEVYADPGQSITASIIESITERVVVQIATGNITVAATIEELSDYANSNPLAFGLDFLILRQSGEFEPNFACAFDPAFSIITLEGQTLRGEADTFNPLVYFGSAQAMFFLLFTAQGGANSILEDKRQGVLERLFATPTPRIVILLGKLVGSFVTAVVQLVLLFIAFTLIGSLIAGEFTLIWGNNWLLIGLLVVVASLSVSGLGTLIAAFAADAEQANIIGTTINITMGALGGAFFAADQIPGLAPVQSLSLVYWGQNAFSTLAAGGSAIGVNLAVMLIQGAIMFVIGLVVFNRRMDV